MKERERRRQKAYIYMKLGARENWKAFEKLYQKKDHIFVPLNQVLMKKELYYVWFPMVLIWCGWEMYLSCCFRNGNSWILILCSNINCQTLSNSIIGYLIWIMSFLKFKCGGGCEMNWEIGIDIYTLICIK